MYWTHLSHGRVAHSSQHHLCRLIHFRYTLCLQGTGLDQRVLEFERNIWIYSAPMARNIHPVEVIRL